MSFSFPTSFLCFSWNSFAASSFGQRRSESSRARITERGEGAEYHHDEQTSPAPQFTPCTIRGSSYWSVYEYKACILKSLKGRTAAAAGLFAHAHMHAHTLSGRPKSRAVCAQAHPGQGWGATLAHTTEHRHHQAQSGQWPPP